MSDNTGQLSNFKLFSDMHGNIYWSRFRGTSSNFKVLGENCPNTYIHYDFGQKGNKCGPHSSVIREFKESVLDGGPVHS